MAKVHDTPKYDDGGQQQDDDERIARFESYDTRRTGRSSISSHMSTSSTYSEEDSEGSFIRAYQKRTDCGHQFVIHDSSTSRRVWNVVLFSLLIYTGTIFPARLCFVEFRIPEMQPQDQGWATLELIVDILFWFDLFINFFFTYTDEFGSEIDSLGPIVKKYTTGYFFLNMVACLPEEAVTPLFHFLVPSRESGDSSVNKLTRMARLQRTTRLARLARLVRLARLAKMAKMATYLSRNFVWRWLQGLRGMRVVNFVVFLFWIVHILACGWYLCAALHNDFEETWVARRVVDTDDSTLLTRGALEQWTHSMYFVFTIFTTVGFGDISAITTGEIVYVIFCMLIGAVVHSIIVSEMINIVTFIDSNQIELQRVREVIDGFVQHTHIRREMKEQMKSWLDYHASSGQMATRFDKEAMREMVTTGLIPQNIMMDLPNYIYGGRLQSNKFLRSCLSHTAELPPRASILISLCLVERVFADTEVVYQLHDHPFSIFLVGGHSGTFAYVGKATSHGGVDEVPISNRPTGHVACSAVSAVKVLAEGPTRASSTRQSQGSPPSKIPSSSTVSGKLKGGMSPMSRISNEGTKSFGLSQGSRSTLPGSPSKTERLEALYPYQLFCSGSYFGDLELFSTGSRRCTTRCEEKGALLVLHKQDLWRIMEDFPHFGNAWTAGAKGREMRRCDGLRKLTVGMDYQAFACCTIQRFYRQHITVPAEKRDANVAEYKRLKTMVRSKSQRSVHSYNSDSSSRPLEGNVVRNVQAEQEIAPSGSSSRAGAAGGDNKSAEVQILLRAGLQNLQQDMQSVLREVRGEAPTRHSKAATRRATFGMKRSKTVSLDTVVSRETSELTVNSAETDDRVQRLEAENFKLRALVAEQQRHLDSLKEIVMGAPPPLPRCTPPPMTELEQVLPGPRTDRGLSSMSDIDSS